MIECKLFLAMYVLTILREGFGAIMPQCAFFYSSWSNAIMRIDAMSYLPHIKTIHSSENDIR